MECLHEEWVRCVLHRDIKSSNVMLDSDFNPHLGDFGLARLMDHEKLEKTTMMAGPFGYMAPEIHYTGKATKESDVYSFGILMLEVVCGRRPVNLQVEHPDKDFMLLQAVWRAHEGGNILSALHPGLLTLHMDQQTTQSINSMSELEIVNELCSNTISVVTADTSLKPEAERKIVPLHLGLRRCLPEPGSRPSMRVVKQVIQELQRSTAEDATTTLSSMPPLPSTMPGYGSVLQVSKLSNGAVNASLDEVEDPSVERSDTMSTLRRRFHSGYDQ